MSQDLQQSTSIIYEGYLWKESLHLKSQRKRWMVLKPRYLYSFKKEKTYENATETFDLCKYDSIDCDDDNVIVSHDEVIHIQHIDCKSEGEEIKTFTLVSTTDKDNSKRIFSSDDESEIVKWVKYIKNQQMLQKSKCDVCDNINLIDDKHCKHCNAKRAILHIEPQILHHATFDKFSIWISYDKSVSLRYVFNKITNKLNQRLYPMKYYVHDVKSKWFSANEQNVGPKNWIHSWAQPITDYTINDIYDSTLSIEPWIRYIHKINTGEITCKYIQHASHNKEEKINDKNLNIQFQRALPEIKKNENLALDCPIYKVMKVNQTFSEKSLTHLYEFTHFHNEHEKSKCLNSLKCKSFLRLQQGGNLLQDRCHIALFNHPVRTVRQMKLAENVSCIINKIEENVPLYQPTDDEKPIDYKDGYLQALIDEVIANGYKYDLCAECGENDDCKHDNYSILEKVDSKLNHIRHKYVNSALNKAQMLSLVLYTCGDCIYGLCSSQRNGNYYKWKFFDFCLWHAIKTLSNLERGMYSVYIGLSKVKLDKKQIKCGNFSTYLSASWNKDIVLEFIEDNGMMIEISESFKNNGFVECCDISWVSDFTYENKILMARSVGDKSKGDEFHLSVVNEQNGIQYVQLKNCD